MLTLLLDSPCLIRDMVIDMAEVSGFRCISGEAVDAILAPLRAVCFALSPRSRPQGLRQVSAPLPTLLGHHMSYQLFEEPPLVLSSVIVDCTVDWKSTRD